MSHELYTYTSHGLLHTMKLDVVLIDMNQLGTLHMNVMNSHTP